MHLAKISVPTLCLAIAGAAFTTPAKALDFYHSRGGHTLTALFGMPAPVLRLNNRQALFLISGNHANMFAGGQSAPDSMQGEALFIDGERSELTFSYFRPLGGCLHAGIDIPLISHSDGYFDSAIESWHDLFKLPNANREEVPQDNLSIGYTDPVGHSLALSSSNTGLGDSTVQLMRPLACRAQSSYRLQSVVRAGLKLPTGDDNSLAGSGAADIFVDITSTTGLIGDSLEVKGSVGLLFTGNSDIFTNQRSLVAFGTAAVSWQYSRSVTLQMQLDWHTPFFDSELTELGEFSAKLDTGGIWTFVSGNAVEIAIQEDITPDTSPDIALYIGYRRYLKH